MSEAVEYELEIISSDEEEQERLMLRSKRNLRNRSNHKQRKFIFKRNSMVYSLTH